MESERESSFWDKVCFWIVGFDPVCLWCNPFGVSLSDATSFELPHPVLKMTTEFRWACCLSGVPLPLTETV